MGIIAASIIGGGLSAAGSVLGGQAAADAARDAAQVGEGVTRDLSRSQLELLRPQIETANAALAQLSQIFGLGTPSQVDFDGILTNISPDAADLQPTGNRGGREFIDPNTGEVYVRARAGGDKGQIKPTGEVRPVAAQPASPGVAAPATAAPGLSLEDLVTNNPLIKFNREQGEEAIARGAAARGLNQSGQTLEDLVTFNQDLSGTGVQQFVLNPLFQLAGFGPSATANSGVTINNASGDLASLALSEGNARASSFQNTGNVLGNFAGSVGDAFILNSILNRKN